MMKDLTPIPPVTPIPPGQVSAMMKDLTPIPPVTPIPPDPDTSPIPTAPMVDSDTYDSDTYSQMVSQASSKTEKVLANAALKYTEVRNLIVYGDKLGPSVGELLREKKTYEAVIEGSVRSNDDITHFFATTGWGLLP